VLDFWVKAKRAGELHVHGVMATNELNERAAAKHAAGVVPNDEFQVEVNGVSTVC
jgi:hypothetical protein